MGNVVGWCRAAVIERVGHAVLTILGATSQLVSFSEFVVDARAAASGTRTFKYERDGTRLQILYEPEKIDYLFLIDATDDALLARIQATLDKAYTGDEQSSTR